MINDHVIKTVATYDAIATSYAVKLESFTPEQERELFLSLLKPDARILDVGCAAGRDSIFFSKKGHKTTGIDLSENLLAIAKRKAPNLKFIRGDLRDKLFKDNSFDAIWACAVLLHLKRDEILGVLRNFHSILLNAGLLYIRMKEGMGEEMFSRSSRIIRSDTSRILCQMNYRGW